MLNLDPKIFVLAHYFSNISYAYSLAESDIHWMSTAIPHAHKEIKKLHDLAKNGEVVTQYSFGELMRHLEMFEYLAENRHHQHAELAEEYTQKYNAAKWGEA